MKTSTTPGPCIPYGLAAAPVDQPPPQQAMPVFTVRFKEQALAMNVILAILRAALR